MLKRKHLSGYATVDIPNTSNGHLTGLEWGYNDGGEATQQETNGFAVQFVNQI